MSAGSSRQSLGETFTGPIAGLRYAESHSDILLGTATASELRAHAMHEHSLLDSFPALGRS